MSKKEKRKIEEEKREKNIVKVQDLLVYTTARTGPSLPTSDHALP